MLRVINNFLLLILLVSCNEELPKVRIDRQVEALESCRETVFVGSITSHKNFMNLMKCLRWHQELPTLFGEIKKIDQDDWNFLTGPIDQMFFVKGASENMDKLFSFLYQSNTNGQLKRIDNYLKRMNIRNWSLIFKAMLSCNGECNNTFS